MHLPNSPQNDWGDGPGVSQQPLGVTDGRNSGTLKHQGSGCTFVSDTGAASTQGKVTECTAASRNDRSGEYLPVLTKIPRMPAFWAPPTSSLQSWDRTGEQLVSGHGHAFVSAFPALHITNSYAESNPAATY